jgi:hypothetical protein
LSLAAAVRATHTRARARAQLFDAGVTNLDLDGASAVQLQAANATLHRDWGGFVRPMALSEGACRCETLERRLVQPSSILHPTAPHCTLTHPSRCLFLSMSLSHCVRYKYLVAVDGVVSAWRLAKQLVSGSVVLLQASPHREFFYKLLRPWVHYVPVDGELSDLAERVRWLKAHDTEARAIAENARRLFTTRLRPQDSWCYMWRAVRSLANVQDFELAVDAVQSRGYTPLELDVQGGVGEDWFRDQFHKEGSAFTCMGKSTSA